MCHAGTNHMPARPLRSAPVSLSQRLYNGFQRENINENEVRFTLGLISGFSLRGHKGLGHNGAQNARGGTLLP